MFDVKISHNVNTKDIGDITERIITEKEETQQHMTSLQSLSWTPFTHGQSHARNERTNEPVMNTVYTWISIHV